MLHAISSFELKTQFETNIRETVAKVLSVSDPVQKETRTYVVEPHPMFYGIINTIMSPRRPLNMMKKFWKEGYLTRVKSEALYLYPYVVDESWAKASYQDLVQPFELSLNTQEEYGGVDSYLTTRLSSKTILRGKPIKERISGSIATLTRELDRIPTLRELTQSMNANLSSYAFPTTDEVSLDHPYIESLYNLTIMAGSSTLFQAKVKTFLSDNKIPIPTNLKMKTKLYVSRADIRAYYVDTDMVRHLCGSILQTLLLCPNRALRRKLVTETYLPSMNKNIINDSIETNTSHTATIMTGDISSFTNNDINSWMMGFSQLLIVLSDREDLNKTFVVMAGGEYVQVKLAEVILLYLITTVGAPAMLPTGSLYIATGGYLGVKANMTLTSQAFAHRMRALVYSSNELIRNVQLKILIGGDDFVIRQISNDISIMNEFARRLQTSIKLYHGQVKDFQVESFSLDHAKKWDSNMKYCKKGLKYTLDTKWSLKDTEITFEMASVQKLPYFSELVETVIPANYDKKMTLIRLFMVQCKHYFSTYEEGDEWVNAYVHTFCQLNRLPTFGNLRWSSFAINPRVSIQLDDFELSRGAFALVSSPMFHSTKEGRRVDPSTRDQIRKLMAKTLIETQLCFRTNRTYHLKDTEKSQMIQQVNSELHMCFTTDKYQFILSNILFIKRNLSHLLTTDHFESESDDN